ncbi:uncharacterized protein SCHCODRAFT_02628721 [Schizophyllum commune H4-8]|uniref:uncharacterized protein n=1 Tax=Schizophyllum commune (strain H4-8 / FGSC 9210) TaxID=578458 RepID=UPI00215F9A93|nr:uncharacterized protein SCHCODRAFT_02628721 [Schizophyllum commune H4-8]KAI5891310.1 hypothetical protein SCHCODRAFT_02628721 [Schizophyllum commune H4-8]
MDYILERRAVAQQVICSGRAPTLADTLLSWKIAVLWTLGDLVDFAARKAADVGLRSPTELALPLHGYGGLWLLGNGEQMRFLAALRVAAAGHIATGLALSGDDGLFTHNTLLVAHNSIDYPRMRSAVELTSQDTHVLANASIPNGTRKLDLIHSGMGFVDVWLDESAVVLPSTDGLVTTLSVQPGALAVPNLVAAPGGNVTHHQNYSFEKLPTMGPAVLDVAVFDAQHAIRAPLSSDPQPVIYYAEFTPSQLVFLLSVIAIFLYGLICMAQKIFKLACSLSASLALTAQALIYWLFSLDYLAPLHRTTIVSRQRAVCRLLASASAGSLGDLSRTSSALSSSTSDTSSVPSIRRTSFDVDPDAYVLRLLDFELLPFHGEDLIVAPLVAGDCTPVIVQGDGDDERASDIGCTAEAILASDSRKKNMVTSQSQEKAPQLSILATDVCVADNPVIQPTTAAMLAFEQDAFQKSPKLSLFERFSVPSIPTKARGALPWSLRRRYSVKEGAPAPLDSSRAKGERFGRLRALLKFGDGPGSEERDDYTREGDAARARGGGTGYGQAPGWGSLELHIRAA